MDSIITPIALIVAGILAASAFIISKAPNAKQLLDKLAPIQGFLGVGLLVWGIIDVIRLLPDVDKLNKLAETYVLFVIAVYAGIVSEVLLGFLLGMPLIAKWIPGESPVEQRAMEMQKKVGAYQTLLGFVGIGAAVILLYYYFKFH
jgi:hypothetical protein